MNNQKRKRNILLIAAAVCIAFVLLFSMLIGNAIGVQVIEKPERSFAIINIKGTIQAGNQGGARVGYDHSATIGYIDSLIEDETNTGIFLDVDSGGGTVYESDETYLKLMEYKEKTGRPIHAYFNSTAASGAYYISCAADRIAANRNCWTGSIGVIISITNVSGLYDKLGIDEVLITSGSNKGMGSAGSPMQSEHIEIYQSLVDESYQQFVEIVSSGRNLDIEQTKKIADGRVYSAQQALDNGLVDEICSYEEALEYMEEITESERYYEPLYVPSAFEKMMAEIKTIVPKSDIQTAMELEKNNLSGVPLYILQQ